MLYNISYIGFFLTLFVLQRSSKQDPVDSLRHLMNNSVGEEKVDLLIEIRGISGFFMDSTYLIEALTLSREKKYVRGEVEILILMGEDSYHQGDSKKAEKLYVEALTIAKQIDDKTFLIDVHDHLAELYDFNVEYIKSYKHISKALELSREINDTICIINALTTEGFLFASLSLIEMSDSACGEALILAEKIKDKFLTIQALGCFLNHSYEDDLKIKMKYVDRVIELTKNDSTDFESLFSYAQMLSFKAYEANKDNEPRRALRYLDMIEKVNKKIDHNWVLADMYLEKGISYKLIGQPDSMKYFLKKSDSLVIETSDFYMQKSLFLEWVNYYDLIGDYEQKSIYLERYKRIEDNVEEDQQVIETIIRLYKDQLKQERSYFLKKTVQNRALGVIISIVFMLILFIGLRRFWMKKMKVVENEKKQFSKGSRQISRKLESLYREMSAQKLEDLERKNHFTFMMKGFKEKSRDVSKEEVIRLLEKMVQNHSDWHGFKTFFEKTEPEFLNKLTKAHSGITSNDLRICAFTKMGLSNKEIARITNVQPSSVIIRKYRLKKKMKIKNSSLDTYIRAL